MRVLRGVVSARHGAATGNLAPYEELILKRTGLSAMVPGTLNITLPERYLVRADAIISSNEYFTGEILKLQRCRAFRRRMIIMRPDSHEFSHSNGANVLELVSNIHLRRTFLLKDGDNVEVEVEGDESWWAAPDPEVNTFSPPKA